MARLALPSDAVALAEIHIATWRHAYRDLLPSSLLDALDHDRRVEWWENYLRGGGTAHVVGEARPVGFCAPGPSDEPGWGEIFSIYVHPDHWGLGLGRELLSAATETLRAEGHERALLWVFEANTRAREFYERQGWSLGKPFRLEELGGRQMAEVRYEIEL